MTKLTARELCADLYILERFDRSRELAGHDYGSGQRARELRNRRFAIDSRPTFEMLDNPRIYGFTDAELLEAFERVGRPKINRIEAEGYRSHTPASRRTLRTWRRLETALRSAAKYGHENVRRELEKTTV